jgi:hypothetical protein
MDINNLFQSKTFKIVVLCIVVFIVLFFVFSLGVFVGTQKANFSFRWAEQYHKNFAGPANGFFQEFTTNDFLDANGVFGKIIKVSDPTIIIKSRNDVEKIILVNEETAIKKLDRTINISDLNIDDDIIAIGNPNDNGQIEASLIRVMPSIKIEINNQNIQLKK